MEKYTYIKKKRIAEKIGKIKNKKDLVKIYEIIKNDKSSSNQISKNNNGMFVCFEKLSDDTYKLLDEFINDVLTENSENHSSERKKYTPYNNDDSMSDKGVSAKLKYSNKERNLIKRKHYQDNLSSEQGSEVVFSVDNLDKN